MADRRTRRAQTARLYHFGEVRTPIFEHTELFHRRRRSQDIVNKEMYTFEDRGQRSIPRPKEPPAWFAP